MPRLTSVLSSSSRMPTEAARPLTSPGANPKQREKGYLPFLPGSSTLPLTAHTLQSGRGERKKEVAELLIARATGRLGSLAVAPFAPGFGISTDYGRGWLPPPQIVTSYT